MKTGLFGTDVNFVPLTGAEVYGDDVVVPYDAAIVKEAPKAEDLTDVSSSDEERALYATTGSPELTGTATSPTSAPQGSPSGEGY